MKLSKSLCFNKTHGFKQCIEDISFIVLCQFIKHSTEFAGNMQDNDIKDTCKFSQTVKPSDT